MKRWQWILLGVAALFGGFLRDPLLALAQDVRGNAVRLITPNGQSAMDDTADAVKVLLSASTNNIGDVDVLTLPNVAQATAANLNTEVQGDAADDAAVSGNPVLVGGESWTDGSSPSSVSAGAEASRLLASPEGRLAVTTDHPRRFICNISSTATTSTLITGCSAPGAGLSRYITDISFGTSASSGTAGRVLQYGTGGSCGTGTTVVFRGMGVTFNASEFSFVTPIKLAANTELCFLDAAAATKNIFISGYVAP